MVSVKKGTTTQVISKIKSKTFDLTATLVYVTLILMPLSFLVTHGGDTYTYKLGGYLLFYELPLAIAVFILLTVRINLISKLRVTKQDILVVVYSWFMLIPIFGSWETLYESMRLYRHDILIPLILYFVYKVSVTNKRQVQVGLLALSLPTIYFAIKSLMYTIETGQRAMGYGLMGSSVVSVFVACGVCILLFSAAPRSKFFYRILRYIGLVVLVCGLISLMTRLPTLALLIGVFMAIVLLRKRWFQKVFVVGFPLLVILLFTIIILTPSTDLQIKDSRSYEEGHSISRLTSTEGYISDVKNRIQLWKMIVETGLDSPVFGNGLNYVSKLKMSVSHAHNTYVNIMAGSGIVGLLLFISIVIVFYNNIFYTLRISPDKQTISVCKIVFVCAFILLSNAFTNALVSGLYPLLFVFLAMGSKMKDIAAKKPG